MANQNSTKYEKCIGLRYALLRPAKKTLQKCGSTLTNKLTSNTD